MVWIIIVQYWSKVDEEGENVNSKNIDSIQLKYILYGNLWFGILKVFVLYIDDFIVLLFGFLVLFYGNLLYVKVNILYFCFKLVNKF